MAVSRDPPLHAWDLDAAQARALQRELAARVETSRPLAPFQTVAGADVSYNKFSPTLYAAVVVLRADTLEEIERAGVVAQASFPYVPGLLSFREAPPVIEAFGKLAVRPEVLICDGQGIAHPRRLGLASHLGLWLGIPTIGCAKSRLCGRYEELGPARGDWTPLVDEDQTIGAVLRTRTGVKPLYVSPGHLCDLEGAIAAVLATTRKYRLPETTRLAHNYVNELRRQEGPQVGQASA
jgi:deoxyribonuclease V